MKGHRIRTEEVLVFLEAREGLFIQELRREGLFESEELEPGEADELRFAKILMEELGVNAAGVDVALHLRRRLAALERRVQTVAQGLRHRSGPPPSDRDDD